MNSEYELIPELEQVLYKNTGASNYRPQNEIQYEVIESDERMPVPESKLAPFRYICYISARLTSNPRASSIGTGFFIGPKTILTAAHNLWDEFVNPNGALVPFRNVEIIPARNENTKPFGSVIASAIKLPYSDFKNSDRGGYKDYAIIHIEGSKGLETGYFGRGVWAQDPIGSTNLRSPIRFPGPIECQSIDVAGYPSDLSNGIKMYKSTDVALGLAGKFLMIRNDTFKSMSGCPVWMTRDKKDGGRTVVGLLLGPGTKDCKGRYVFNVARYIDDEVRKFITNNYK
jgi:V8-like Glu-specific endopeptidase